MSQQIAHNSLALQDNFNAIILDAFFLHKFVTVVMIVKISQMNNFVTITHAYPNNSSAQANSIKMGPWDKVSVSRWKNDVIGRQTAPMEKMRNHVPLRNVRRIISNVPTKNVFPVFGYVTETTIVGTTQTNARIVFPEIVLRINSDAPLDVAFQ